MRIYANNSSYDTQSKTQNARKGLDIQQFHYKPHTWDICFADPTLFVVQVRSFLQAKMSIFNASYSNSQVISLATMCSECMRRKACAVNPADEFEIATVDYGGAVQVYLLYLDILWYLNGYHWDRNQVLVVNELPINSVYCSIFSHEITPDKLSFNKGQCNLRKSIQHGRLTFGFHNRVIPKYWGLHLYTSSL